MRGNEWPTVSIGDLEKAGFLELRPGFAQGEHNEEGRGVPHLRPFNVTADGRITLEKVKYVELPPGDSPHWLQVGDVIFNNTNSEDLTGKTALFESDARCVPSNHITVLRAASENAPDPYWLAAHFRHLWLTGFFRGRLRRYVGQASVSLTRLREIEIPVPPLPEQRAIARVLRTVQRAKEGTEQVIAAARELKKSLMRHLFTFGPVAVSDSDRVTILRMNRFSPPKAWKVVPLGEIVEILDRRRIPLSADVRRRMQGPYPYCGANGVLDYIDDFIFEGQHLLLAEDGGRWGPCEPSSYLMEGRFWVNNHAHVLRAVDSVTSNAYLNYWLNYTDIQVHISGSTRGKLNQGIMKAIPIPLPPRQVQDAITERLRVVDLKIAAEEARRDALAALFDSLLHDLMTARVRLTDLISEVA